MTAQIKNPDMLLLYSAAAAVGFAPLIDGGTTHLPVLVLRLAVAFMLAVFLVAGARRGVIELPRTPLDLPIAVFFLASILSCIIAPYKYMALVWLQSILSYIIFFYLARSAMSAPGSSGFAIKTVLVMGAVESAWGIVQWLTGGGRAHGSFFNPNMLAVYLVPAAALAVSMLINGHSWSSRLLARAGLLSVALACTAGIVLSGSRGGALVLLAAVFMVTRARSRRLALTLVAGLVLFVALVPNPVMKHITDREKGADPYSFSRAKIWEGALRMTLDHPQGVGLGNFKYEWPQYNFPVDEAVMRYGKSASTAHNEYLHAAAEMGIAGLAAVFFLVFALVRVLARRSGKGADADENAVLTGLSAGIAAILLHSLVDANLHEPGVVFLLILLAAAFLSLSDKGASVSWSFRTGQGGGSARFTALSGILAAVLAVWLIMPGLAYYCSEKGKAAAKAGRVGDALRLTGWAVALESGNSSYREQRASMLYTAGGRNLEAALEELGQAESLNPHSATYPALEGRLLFAWAVSATNKEFGRKAAEAALERFEASTRLDPYNATVLYDTARTELYIGRQEDAAATLERLKGYEPNFLRGRLLLALIYKETGREVLSLEECYSIIRIKEALGDRWMSDTDRNFTEVESDKLSALMKGLEAVTH